MGKQKPSRMRSPSMRTVIILSMLALILIIVLVFSGMVSAAGLLPSLDDVSYRTLYNHASDQVSAYSSEMTLIARSARQTANALQSQHQATVGSAPPGTREEGLDAFLEDAMAQIQVFLDAHAVTGAFVALEASYTATDAHHAALYLRDPSPGVAGSNDLTVLMGPKRLISSMSLEQNWVYELVLNESTALDDRFYRQPLGAALLYPKADSRDWGYWSEPFRLHGNDYEIITFTTPLVDAQGNVLGVFGVEFSVSYMTQIMPAGSLPFGDGFYLVGMVEDDSILTRTAFSSDVPGSRYLLGYGDRIPYTLAASESSYRIYEAAGDTAMYLAMVPMGLYGNNSPFLDREYYLFAFSVKDDVLRSSRNILQGLAMALGVALPVSIAAAVLFSRYFAGKIETLATEVRESDPTLRMELSDTNIREVDELKKALEAMSVDIAQHAARMSTIVDLVGIPVGAFELHVSGTRVFMTSSLFRMLGVKRESGSHYVEFEQFQELLSGLHFPEDDNVHVELEKNLGTDLAEQWVKIQMLRRHGNVYGTVVDITEDVQQKRWLEYERDYDPLTMLLNRNAYPLRMNELIRSAPGEQGVLLFGDLDNLKYINDTFGHDMGDRYIKMAAQALRVFEEAGGVVARVSGDEFVVYLHGLGGRHKLREVVDEGMLHVREQSMELPDGQQQKVRISVGLAYYPHDADNIDTLIQYADFAMYEIKHTVKGNTHEFVRESYDKNSYILRKPNQLDRLIEGRRMRFAFQPIIDVTTGEVYAYEALMRPQTREFHTPLEVLNLARSQSKLYQIEHLTFECLFEWLTENKAALGGRLLFVNSISNQMLRADDLMHGEPPTPEERAKIVIEFTEEEQGSQELVDKKVAYLRERGYSIALDDYGTGYNNEALLLSIKPDYIKVDITIVRDVDRDENRQRLFKQMVDYASANGIGVLAEGVETPSEMETVVRLGTRYVQGFYFGRPEFELGREDRVACAQARQVYARRHQKV